MSVKSAPLTVSPPDDSALSRVVGIAPVSGSGSESASASAPGTISRRSSIQPGSIGPISPQPSAAVSPAPRVASSSDGETDSVYSEASATAASADSQRVLEQRINSGHFIRKFGLPPDSTLLYDCLCLMYKNGLPIQGRMYLSQAHLCFFSKIFGSETREVVPLHDVTAISKRGLGLIELLRPNEKLLFAGFLSRDKAYNMINSSWEHALPLPAPPPVHPPSPKMPSDLSKSPAPADGAAATDGAAPVPAGEEAQGEDLMLSEVDDNGTSGFLETTSLNELCKADFDVSVVKFFKLFFADNSQGWNGYHREREDKDVYTGNWQSHPQFGNVRDKRFIIVVKGSPFGPPTSRLEETHRHSLTKSHLVVEMVQTMMDIPFGDSFRVEAKWDVTQTSPTSCQLVVSVGVRWIKRTMLKGKIESATLKQSGDNYKMWADLAKKFVASSSGDGPRMGLSVSTGAAPSVSAPSSPSSQVASASAVSNTPSGPSAAKGSVDEGEGKLDMILGFLSSGVGAVFGSLTASDRVVLLVIFVMLLLIYRRLGSIEDLLAKGLQQ